MEYSDLARQIDELKEKLHRAQRQTTGLRQKSKYLELQYGDSKDREKNTNELVMQLLDRQRELNVILNRANIMLNRTQEVMALTAMEFNEMAKALPEPKKAEWSERVTKVNELFKKTGVQDAEIGALEGSSPPPGDLLDAEALAKESENAFPKKAAVWDRREPRKPPHVEAEAAQEESSSANAAELVIDEVLVQSREPENEAHEVKESTESKDQDQLVFAPRRKSWWQRTAR